MNVVVSVERPEPVVVTKSVAVETGVPPRRSYPAIEAKISVRARNNTERSL